MTRSRMICWLVGFVAVAMLSGCDNPVPNFEDVMKAVIAERDRKIAWCHEKGGAAHLGKDLQFEKCVLPPSK